MRTKKEISQELFTVPHKAFLLDRACVCESYYKTVVHSVGAVCECVQVLECGRGIPQSSSEVGHRD